MAASEKERTAIQAENQQDLANYSGGDHMEKRLLVDDAKIDGMILSLKQCESRRSIGQVRLIYPDNGMKISNKTAFGTILIIYESRPVTVEAGGIAFKSE
jgi:glutamate-5-semialdehyde dehydrogenase